ncbi:hypothetical protein ABB37_05095 [Leptomonas pyrrhocoris]|uniref:Queuosine 5'-phosphate N-glycosylase/hydrolase n=1 Tax=Leptomonas pyrrhocoris TaxID=157538 RepID=A0A0M9G141_LEPPY|nr:hypothetical protein ABB37_05095 [Leptomonas pyrrhocoris]KPA80093.1 hypothetical protein ABB37_05095 [Leptomonas pyrrhocoris]|eukprot:XP_015658532.1 hypothetical protein ABB37_05095 [Leptomonas pyrrhocoris]
MDIDRVYSGESVRHAIRRLYGEHSDVPVKLPHATVPPITTALVREHAEVFDTILRTVREQVDREQQSAEEASFNTTATGHWLLSVPPSLWQHEAEVVNYLGMLVAIDFCHWAEVHPISRGDREEESATMEEGGIVSAPGEAVTGFAGFYTVVEEEEESPSAASTLQSAGSRATEVLTEPKDKAEGPPGGGGGGVVPAAKDVTLLRGSAAMMFLLRRAVAVHRVPWYDIDYLQQFHGDVAAALREMKVCFLGCQKDGATPLWMPCTRARVRLLLSLAEAFAEQHTSFYQLLRECAGYMFRPPANTAAARAGVRGFVPSLVRFHPRYHDFAHECGSDASSVSSSSSSGPAHGNGAAGVPILKLSQLTALALEQSLPELWRCRCRSAPSSFATSPATALSLSWMAERAVEVVKSHGVGLFTDRAELSICCDYQIPKALRAAGLLLYDAHLAQMVDHHVLLRPGAAEEASIRIATLVAADRLLEFLNAQRSHTSSSQKSPSTSETTCMSCSVNHLDYTLWYIGRYMVPSEARHHLCRTIMY